MKLKNIGSAIFAVYLCAYCTNAVADNVPLLGGFGKAAWGVSSTELESLMENDSIYIAGRLTVPRKWIGTERLLSWEGEIESSTGFKIAPEFKVVSTVQNSKRVTYYFSDDQLCCVQVEFEEGEPDQYPQVLSALIEKYGAFKIVKIGAIDNAATKSRRGRNSYFADEWSTESGKLRLCYGVSDLETMKPELGDDIRKLLADIDKGNPLGADLAQKYIGGLGRDNLFSVRLMYFSPNLMLISNEKLKTVTAELDQEKKSAADAAIKAEKDKLKQEF